MNPQLQTVIAVLVIALVAMAAYASYVEGQRRTHQLGALAIQLGWQFDLRGDDFHSERYGHFSVFNKGDSRRAYNTMSGSLDVGGQLWPVRAGDYSYQSTSGSGQNRSKRTHRLSYAVIDTPHVDAPNLLIRREGLFDRFAGFLGFDDIDFESAEFSERFHVKSSHKRFAYAVLDPRMMEFLLDSEPPTIELRRGQCCLLLGERRWSPEEFTATIQWAQEFLARWPAQVPTIFDA
jgi:hypothetical protein